MKVMLRLSVASLIVVSTFNLPARAESTRVSLTGPIVLVASEEPSYVQYGAKDVAGYLGQISGETVEVSGSAGSVGKAKTVIAIGKAAAVAVGGDAGSTSDLGEEGFVIRTADKGGRKVVVVAGD